MASSNNCIAIYICHAMFTCTSRACSLAFKCLVRPQREYACQVWNPHLVKDIQILEAIQKRAARWTAHAKWNRDTYTWSKTTEACLQELRWPSLANRRDYLCISFLFDLLHQRYTLSFNSYCSFKTITYLRSHSLSLQTVNSSINAYHYSYFVNIPFLLNSLPADIVSLPTASQFRQSIRSYFLT